MSWFELITNADNALCNAKSGINLLWETKVFGVFIWCQFLFITLWQIKIIGIYDFSLMLILGCAFYVILKVLNKDLATLLYPI